MSNQFEDIMLYFRSLPKTVDYVRLWKVCPASSLLSSVLLTYVLFSHICPLDRVGDPSQE
jgi:hypothetical protein